MYYILSSLISHSDYLIYCTDIVFQSRFMIRARCFAYCTLRPSSGYMQKIEIMWIWKKKLRNEFEKKIEKIKLNKNFEQKEKKIEVIWYWRKLLIKSLWACDLRANGLVFITNPADGCYQGVINRMRFVLVPC